MKMPLLVMTYLVLVSVLVHNIFHGPRFVKLVLAMVLVPKGAVKARQLMEIRSLGMGLEPEVAVCRRGNSLRRGHLINKEPVPAMEARGMVLVVLVPALDPDTALRPEAFMAAELDTMVVQVVMQAGHTMLAAVQAGLTMLVSVPPPAPALAELQIREQLRLPGLLQVVPKVLKCLNSRQTTQAELQDSSLHGHKRNVNKLKLPMLDNPFYLILDLRFLLVVHTQMRVQFRVGR